MWTTGASAPDPCTDATMVPSGADSMRYQTVASTRPHFDTCGSSRSTVASTVVPWADAGNDGRSCASALLSFGGGASAGATSASATSAVSTASTSFVVRNPGSCFQPPLSRLRRADRLAGAVRGEWRAGPRGRLAGGLDLGARLASDDDRDRDEHERRAGDDPERDRLVEDDRAECDRDHRIHVRVGGDLAERRVREQPGIGAVPEQRAEDDQVPQPEDRTGRIVRRIELDRAVNGERDDGEHDPTREHPCG